MTYITKDGDMWDLISFQQLGTEYSMGDILSLNPTYANVLSFDAGVILTLPDKPVLQNVFGMPPWRKVTTTNI
jgi:phage tail protein X